MKFRCNRQEYWNLKARKTKLSSYRLVTTIKTCITEYFIRKNLSNFNINTTHYSHPWHKNNSQLSPNRNLQPKSLAPEFPWALSPPKYPSSEQYKPPNAPYHDSKANLPKSYCSNAPSKHTHKFTIKHFCVTFFKSVPLKIDENQPLLYAYQKNWNQDWLELRKRVTAVPLLLIFLGAVGSIHSRTLPLVRRLEGQKIFHCQWLPGVVICSSNMRSKKKFLCGTYSLFQKR